MAVSQEKPVETNKIKQKKAKKRKNKPPSNEETNPAVDRKDTSAVLEPIPSGKSVKKKRAVQENENISEPCGVTDKVLNGVEGDLVGNLGQNETADEPPRKKKKRKEEKKGEEERVNSTSVIDQALETESAEAGQTSPSQKKKRKKNKGNNPGTNLDDTKTVCVNADDADASSKEYKGERVVENVKAKKKGQRKGNGANSEVKEPDFYKSAGGTQNGDRVGPQEQNNDEPETKKRKKMKSNKKRTDKENNELIKKSDIESEEAVKNGQLETPTFEDKESQKKYTCIKFLGGNKKGSDQQKLAKKLKVKKGDQSSDKQAEDEEAPPAKLVMSKIQERLLTIALESQNEKASSFNKDQGVDLGFEKEGGDGNKYQKNFNSDFKNQNSFSHQQGKLRIDTTASKSVKFSDDD